MIVNVLHWENTHSLLITHYSLQPSHWFCSGAIYHVHCPGDSLAIPAAK